MSERWLVTKDAAFPVSSIERIFMTSTNKDDNGEPIYDGISILTKGHWEVDVISIEDYKIASVSSGIDITPPFLDMLTKLVFSQIINCITETAEGASPQIDVQKIIALVQKVINTDDLKDDLKRVVGVKTVTTQPCCSLSQLSAMWSDPTSSRNRSLSGQA